MKFVEAIQKKINPPGTSCDKDIAMAVLMRDPDNFASLINGTGFFAEKILPEDLVERDSRLASLRFADMERMKKKGQTLYRDVYKTWYGRYTFHVGLENASMSDPTLAVRNLNYDATEYHVQTVSKQRENRKKWENGKKGLSNDEWLRKLEKTEPVEMLMTAVLFTGEEWDCASDIRDMIPVPDDYVKRKPTWPLEIINPHEMSDEKILAMESNDMKFFMGVVKYSKDSEAMKNFIDQYCNTFTVSPEIAYITGVVTNTKWLEEKYRWQRDEREESENMCLAFEEWERKARTAGRVEGKAEGKAEGIAEGKAAGIAEGITKGITKGISEERKRNVLSMHNRGFSAGSIADILVIEEKEVEEIISSLQA